MPVNIARVRFLIVVLALVVVGSVIAFFAYARYKAHRLISDLPGKLGVEVSRETNGFTYSQSIKGRTAFTIHASKAVQFREANLTLHDVIITLYGAQGDRSDRIAGSEFNYDQKAGIVTAKGAVQIDLQGVAGSAINGLPAGKGNEARPGDPKRATNGDSVAAEGVIHVKTSGLIFNQNTQLATTTEFVEFSTPKGAGHATGASYDVPKGLLVLDSAIDLNSNRNGVPILVHASHAEFLRGNMQASLRQPVATYQMQSGAADETVVSFRKDGSAERLDALGHIHLKSEDGKEMNASKARLLLNERSQPQRADASGGLTFASNSETGEMHGNALEGTLLFGRDGNLAHAQARNAVHFVDVRRDIKDGPQASATRELQASRIDVDFSRDGADHAVPNRLTALGGASAVLHTSGSKSAAQNVTIKADQLLAKLRDGRSLTDVRGEGNTSVFDVSPSGATSLTTGDRLQVVFADPPNRSSNGGQPSDTAQIHSVTQEGKVVITQTPAITKGVGQPIPTRVTAGRADYDASAQLLRLTGSPRIDDGATNLAADAIEYNRATSVAYATGGVKATYLPIPGKDAAAAPKPTAAPGFGGSGPTHVIAASAVLRQAQGLAIFRGQARLWQGANSVSAPVIELSRNPQTLKAYAEPAANDAVTTVMAASARAQSQPGVFRVQSRRLVYEDSQQSATFSGSVTAEQAGGALHADEVRAFLAPPEVHAKTDALQTAGGVDRIVATGHIEFRQPGRRGTGDELVYTERNGTFVLTGSPANPPRIYDQGHGNVTGDSLIFNSQDDSVSVTGGQSRAVTDTRTAR